MKEKKPFYKKWWFILITIIVIIGALGRIGNKKDIDVSADTSTSSIQSTESASSTPSKSESKITYENFCSIQMGMTYDQVKEVLGDGQEQSSNEVSGIKTVMYSWSGSGVSNMNVTIQNDEVVGKAQSGLYKDKANITMDQYNKIENGMTYDQVKGILGEGEISSQTKIMDAESTMYSYINKDGSNANFTFDASGMSAKAQFNLK